MNDRSDQVNQQAKELERNYFGKLMQAVKSDIKALLLALAYFFIEVLRVIITNLTQSFTIVTDSMKRHRKSNKRR